MSDTTEPSHEANSSDEVPSATGEVLLDIMDNTVGFVGLLTPDGILTEANATALEAGGVTRDEVLGKKFWDCFWWSHDEDEMARLEDAVTRARNGEVVRYDARVRMAGDTRMWIAFMLSPLRNDQGEVYALVASGFDITERKVGETKLRAAHDTFRQMVECSPFGIYIVDADFKLYLVSNGAQKVFETVRPLLGRDFAEILRILWPEPFATEAIGRFRHTLETGEPYHAPSTVETRADIQQTEAYDWKIERLELPDGRPGIVCHFYDLSERQRFEEQIKLLMGEVNHRAKNMLTLVLSIARQTASFSPEDFLERFTQRIQGLSAGQDLLVQSGWRHVSMEALARAQLAHFRDLIGQRIHLGGPEIEINAAAAQAIGLALHELATNAAKYGALSDQKGQVNVVWKLYDEAGQPRFSLDWIETHGPRVEPPEQQGFGSNVTGNLIKTSLNGEVTTEFASTGLEWQLICPADGVVDDLKSERLPVPDSPDVAAASQRNCILVVDDEPLISLDVAQSLEEAGFDVIGPAGSVKAARALLEKSGCSAAVLDVNLGRETSEPLAKDLLRAGIPFVAVSGYSQSQLPDAFQDMPLISKPINFVKLVRCLKDLLA